VSKIVSKYDVRLVASTSSASMILFWFRTPHCYGLKLEGRIEYLARDSAETNSTYI